MNTAQATKTLRQPLEHRPGVSEWFGTTQVLFNRVAAFYFGVLDAHTAVLEVPTKDALTVLERLTHATARNLHPAMPLSAIASQVPAYFRRAAIHAALGARRSFQARQERWQRAKAKAEANGKPCRVRPPVPPRTWNRSVVLYAGMSCTPSVKQRGLSPVHDQSQFFGNSVGAVTIPWDARPVPGSIAGDHARLAGESQQVASRTSRANLDEATLTLARGGSA
jgi:hypothetical protein